MDNDDSNVTPFRARSGKKKSGGFKRGLKWAVIGAAYGIIVGGVVAVGGKILTDRLGNDYGLGDI